jgi:hypothetical protein
VSVSPRYEDRIRDIIQELDVDPPQVLIQVLLAEVTLDTSFDWGVDLAFTAGNVTGGFELASTPGLGNLPALGGGVASAAVAGQGVPSISVSAGDFQLLIKALSVQGRLQVLSNPAVMAANNEPARIQVGETIRVPDATSFDLGSQQTSVIAEDVGIILSVTPFINPDGFVRMAVQPEISELSKRTTQISEDCQAPIIQRRNADTTVTVRDGQTIVIGGLISDRYERRDTKVPLFGDLPLIGPLFRNESVSTVKTELLIVLTPHVIESPGQIDLLTESEVDRLSLPSELKDQIRRSMLEGRLFDSKGERCLLCGCVTDVTTSDGRPLPPEPVAPPQQPEGLVPSELVLRLGAKPSDSDGNGYPDLIAVEAYLFAPPFPSPIFAEGSFTFDAYADGHSASGDMAPMASWNFSKEEVATSGTASPFGHAYAFLLSLRETCGDNFPVMNINIRVRFESVEGTVIEPMSVGSVTIGRSIGVGR